MSEKNPAKARAASAVREKTAPENQTTNGQGVAAAVVAEAASVADVATEPVADAGAEEVSAASDEAAAEETQPDDDATRIARLFLHDFVVTSLLRQGKALKTTELVAAAAQGASAGSPRFQISRASLQHGGEGSPQLAHHDREWDLQVRVARRDLSREERARQPMETTLRELMLGIGKPLPVPVIAREISTIRGTHVNNMKEVVTQVLRSAFWAVEISTDTWLHSDFEVEVGAGKEELIVRENQLASDPDFEAVKDIALPAAEGTPAQRAAAMLRTVARPLSRRLLGYLLWKQDNAAFNSRALSTALADRTVFYPAINGNITLLEQLPLWYDSIQNWGQTLGESANDDIDVAALLRQRVAPGDTIAPKEQELNDIKEFAKGSHGHPIALLSVMLDILEMEADDPRFIGSLQGLNDALRRDPDFLPVGVGRFLLRAAVPAYVGQVPDELRPVQLSVRNPETDEPFDFEMTDEGLEGDAVDFIHLARWEDVNEEVEVKMPRRIGTDLTVATGYVLLNHHRRAGTIKLRRMDEDFFALEGGLARLTVRGEWEEKFDDLHAWVSRESALIYGLADWLGPRTPPSGGVLLFSRDPAVPGVVKLTIEEPHVLTHIEGARAEVLEALREASTYMSLFELLQNIMAHHEQGVELPTLWAEVNMVRRTSKRLVCSVLSGYHCFYFKQRGPKQILWRFDNAKLDQGVKRNKRKFVKR